MAKSKNLKGISDKEKYQIVTEEIKKFNALIQGHRKILEAIGNL